MKIGLYGGSFDPIHHGHIRPVREARDALGLDRVIYLPTARPPHKPRRTPAPALARYVMVELALLGEERMSVSTLELADRVTYTIETLKHFRRLEPEARLFLILGSDSFARLDTWRQWREILTLAELAVLERPGVAETGHHEPSAELLEALEDARVHRIRNAPVAVSSTAVRRRLAEHSEDLPQLVPTLVLDYIVKYGLYQ